MYGCAATVWSPAQRHGGTAESKSAPAHARCAAHFRTHVPGRPFRPAGPSVQSRIPSGGWTCRMKRAMPSPTARWICRWRLCCSSPMLVMAWHPPYRWTTLSRRFLQHLKQRGARTRVEFQQGADVQPGHDDDVLGAEPRNGRTEREHLGRLPHHVYRHVPGQNVRAVPVRLVDLHDTHRRATARRAPRSRYGCAPAAARGQGAHRGRAGVSGRSGPSSEPCPGWRPRALANRRRPPGRCW